MSKITASLHLRIENSTAHLAAANMRERAVHAADPALRAALLIMAAITPALEAALTEVAQKPTTLEATVHGLGSALGSAMLNTAQHAGLADIERRDFACLVLEYASNTIASTQEPLEVVRTQ